MRYVIVGVYNDELYYYEGDYFADSSDIFSDHVELSFIHTEKWTTDISQAAHYADEHTAYMKYQDIDTGGFDKVQIDTYNKTL